MISGSCDDGSPTEWPCYWVSNLNGNVFPCMRNVSLPVQRAQPCRHHSVIYASHSSVSAKNDWLRRLPPPHLSLPYPRGYRERICWRPLYSSGTTSILHSRLANNNMIQRTILIMERQPFSFRFTASNMASFLSSQSEQTIDVSSSLAHKTFTQAERKLNAFKLANFGRSKTFYVMFSHRSASSSQIPVHKTEQYPLPAMHIDESTLEGTLGVMSTIFRSTLDLAENGGNLRRRPAQPRVIW